MHQAGRGNFLQGRGVLLNDGAQVVIAKVELHIFALRVFQHGFHDLEKRLLPGVGAQVGVAFVAKIGAGELINFPDDTTDVLVNGR